VKTRPDAFRQFINLFICFFKELSVIFYKVKVAKIYTHWSASVGVPANGEAGRKSIGQVDDAVE